MVLTDDELIEWLNDFAANQGSTPTTEMLYAAADRIAELTPSDGAKIIREFHGDGVWRDDAGTIWVRQRQLVTAVQTWLGGEGYSTDDEDVAYEAFVQSVNEQVGAVFPRDVFNIGFRAGRRVSE